MDRLELTIRYLGIGTLTAISLALIAGALFFLVMVVVRLTPRLHIGKPQNDGELCFYDARVVSERRLISEPLKIKWWAGLSRRSSPKWFVGFIRWDPET